MKPRKSADDAVVAEQGDRAVDSAKHGRIAGRAFHRLICKLRQAHRAKARGQALQAAGGRLPIGVGARAAQRIGERAPTRLVEQRDRLRAAITELANGVALDDQRLAQEVAILADKLDVAEEISRFHSHFVAFRATIASPSPEGVGKRLGFLLQELLREANTTGSKANDASMLQNVILIKEELERIREQVENLE